MESRTLLSGDLGAVTNVGLTSDAVLVQPDGKVVVAGHLGGDTAADPRTEATLKRYLRNGSLDPTFGSSGVVRVYRDPFSSVAVVPRFRELVLQSDGKIVAVGDEYPVQYSGQPMSGTNLWADIAMRFTPDGKLDTGYGARGIAHAFPGGGYNPYGGFEKVTSAGLDSDGSLLFMSSLVTSHLDGDSYTTYVGKFDTRGRLDPSFGSSGGIQEVYSLEPSTMSVRPDDQIDLVGSYYVKFGSDPLNLTSHFDFYTERRSATGQALPKSSARINFGTSKTQSKSSDDKAFASALQTDDGGQTRLVLAGTSEGDFALARLNADFTPDDTFGDGGKVTLDLGGDDSIKKVLALADGRLMVVGTSVAGTRLDAVVAIFKWDGNPDPSFGVDGRLVYDSGTVAAAAAAPSAARATPFATPAPGDWTVDIPEDNQGGGDVPLVSNNTLRGAQADHEPPTAALDGAPADVVDAGGTAYDVAVTYTDNLGLYRATLGDGDLELVAPDGTRLPGHLVTAIDHSGRPPLTLTLTYRFTPPGGAWDLGDNGTYLVALGRNQVEDPSGNVAAGSPPGHGLGLFAVDVPAGEVWGCVFHDTDADGVKAKSERKGLRATLYLDLDNDGVYDTGDDEPMTTSSPRSGNFAFLDLAPGDYVLRQVPPAGYRQTLPRRFYAITVAAGDDAGGTWYRFGDTTLAYLSGTVYEDADADGARDGSETVLGGRRVFVDLDADGVFDLGGEPWALSDANGLFVLPAVPIGKSWLRIEPGNGYTTFSPTGGYRLRLGAAQVAKNLDLGLR